MPGLKATLFGRFRIEKEDLQPLEGLEAHKVRELLSLLLVFWERPQPRETLAERLWEGQPPEKSKKNLRQTLWRLRTVLDDCRAPCAPTLLADPEWIQINPSIGLQLDIADFERTFNRYNDRRARDLDEAGYQALQRAVSLYRGDLLEGWYQEWCMIERERFQSMYLLLLSKLVQYCELHQEWEMGLVYGEKLLRHDRAYERTHRQLMRLYFLAGDRTAALRQFQRCATALKEELGVEPSARTLQLYEQIRTGRLRRPLPLGGRQAPREAGQVSTENIRRLDEIAETLSGIPSQIQKDIGLQPGQLDTL